MLPYEFVQYENELNLVMALARALHCTMTAAARQTPALALGPVELIVLAVLIDAKPRTAAALSAVAGCRSSTMTGVLDRLVGHGFVQRRPHPKDRRAILVGLTGAGDQAAREVAAALGGAVARGLAGVPAASLAAAQQVLAALGRA